MRSFGRRPSQRPSFLSFLQSILIPPLFSRFPCKSHITAFDSRARHTHVDALRRDLAEHHSPTSPHFAFGSSSSQRASVSLIWAQVKIKTPLVHARPIAILALIVQKRRWSRCIQFRSWLRGQTALGAFVETFSPFFLHNLFWIHSTPVRKRWYRQELHPSEHPGSLHLGHSGDCPTERAAGYLQSAL